MFFHLAEDSDSGALEIRPPGLHGIWKAGDSFIDRRIQTLMPSSRNGDDEGTRQPHSAKSFSPR